MVMIILKRLFVNLASTPFLLRRYFSHEARTEIAEAISESERRHGAEVRFAVESSLNLWELLRGVNSRKKAIEVFHSLRISNTRSRNGVLVYLLLSESRIELVVDDGAKLALPESRCSELVRGLAAAFQRKDYKSGVLELIEELTVSLAQHYPPHGEDQDELANDVHLP